MYAGHLHRPAAVCSELVSLLFPVKRNAVFIGVLWRLALKGWLRPGCSYRERPEKHIFTLGCSPRRQFGDVRALFSFFRFLLQLGTFQLKVCDGEYLASAQ